MLFRSANNSLLESSIWDLRVVFGQLEKTLADDTMIDWKVSVTMPWAAAKLLCYYFHANILVHEAKNGQIEIPKAVIPDEPPKDLGRDLYKALMEARQKLLPPSMKDGISSR